MAIYVSAVFVLVDRTAYLFMNRLNTLCMLRISLEEPYRQVAGLLYEQLERGQAEPAQIISRFEGVEEQRMVAGMFRTTLSAKMDNRERKRWSTNWIHRIQERSIEHQTRTLTDFFHSFRILSARKRTGISGKTGYFLTGDQNRQYMQWKNPDIPVHR